MNVLSAYPKYANLPKLGTCLHSLGKRKDCHTWCIQAYVAFMFLLYNRIIVVVHVAMATYVLEIFNVGGGNVFDCQSCLLSTIEV